jgi:8-oxo-dGTP diphosphatase
MDKGHYITKEFFRQLKSQAASEGKQGFVAAGLIMDQGKVLLLRRQPGDWLPGMYELPSGKVEEGESIDAGLKREVWEETGLKVKKITDYLGSFDYLTRSGKDVRQFNFIVSVNAPLDIKLTEHDDYKWLAKDELGNYKVTEHVKKIVCAAYVSCQN